MQKIKMYLNKVQIIGIILATIMVIIIPIINDYKFVSLGWFFIGIANFGNAMFTKKWSMLGRTWNEKDDTDPEKQITRKYSDKTFYIVGFLGIALCPVALFETFFSQNYIAMTIAYIATAVVLVVLFKITDKEQTKVDQLIPEIRK